MKHTYIYSSSGMPTSVLGWILQQSDSYDSCFFKCNSENLQRQHTDPWDNHSDNHDDWSHSYIECIENDNDNFEWIDKFVDSFDSKSVFGLSYGAWNKSIAWFNKNVDVVVVQDDQRTVDLFWKSYMCREFDRVEVQHSLDAHVHDHHQDDENYRLQLMNRVGNKALEYVEHTSVKFWQLQHVYHHKGSSFPDDSMEDELKQMIYDASTGTNYNNLYDEHIEVDIFNLDLKALCRKLGIVYNDKMEEEYNKFLDYVNNVVQV